MKDEITFIHIVNGNFENEYFSNIISTIFKETEESFNEGRYVSAFYKTMVVKNKPYHDVVGLTLMSRFMSLGTFKSILDDVSYFISKCYNSFKHGYLKMYVFSSGNNAYEYRIDIAYNKYSIKFKGIQKDYKKVIKTN